MPELSDALRGSLQKFSAQWDKEFSTENLETPPTLSSIIFFATGNFLKHSTEVFPYGIFRHRETKISWHKMVILPPPSYPQNFSIPEILWNRRDPLRSFSVLWDRKLSAKHWCPPPSYAWKFSIQEFFWNTEGFSYEAFRYCETEILNEKSWYPLFFIKI